LRRCRYSAWEENFHRDFGGCRRTRIRVQGNDSAQWRCAIRFVALKEVSGPRTVLAVDLGYSSERRSCGIALSNDSIARCWTFGDALTEVATILTNVPQAVLVLEGVLSTSHCHKGNPRDRGAFEKGRSWYYGPGAVTFLAATRFLAELSKLLPATQVVDLAEAFLSKKHGRPGHQTDSCLIAKKFWTRQPEPLVEGVEPILPIVSGVPPVRSFVYPR
jgi:hypothetical protein